eukprot:5587533-Amphidinium_carterae.1
MISSCWRWGFQEKCLSFWRDGGSFQFSQISALLPRSDVNVVGSLPHSSDDSPPSSSQSSSSSSSPRLQTVVPNDRSSVGRVCEICFPREGTPE